MNKDEFRETARFCQFFDKFFDCLNTRRAGEGKEKLKPDLEPYRSEKDVRFKVSLVYTIVLVIIKLYPQWLEDEFLGYLTEWKESVDERKGFDEKQKARMMLSRETLEGLKMTGNAM